MTLEQIHAELERVRDREFLWRIIAAIAVIVALACSVQSRLEELRTTAYRETSYELVMSAPESEDRSDALQALANIDQH